MADPLRGRTATPSGQTPEPVAGPYRAVPAAMVRIPAATLPAASCRRAWLAEAVAVSSPSLHQADPASGSPADRDRQRLARRAYQARWRARATPFGLLAGVTGAAISDTVTADGIGSVGTTHRSHSRPDHSWTARVLEMLLRDPQILDGARVARHPCVRRRGGRLICQRWVDGDDARGAVQIQETSVAATPAVRRIVELAAAPIQVAALIEALCGQRPELQPAAVRSAIGGLVQAQVLVVMLDPDPGSADPLGHLLAHLPATTGAARAPLQQAATCLAAYDQAQPGRRAALLEQTTAALREVAPARQLLQVDLAVDAAPQLPAAVTGHAQQAANLLWRLFGDAAQDEQISDWHARFLEQHGTDRLVPLLEATDDHTGLGLPPSYLHPDLDSAGSRPPWPGWLVDWQSRLVHHATRHQLAEVDLAEHLGPIAGRLAEAAGPAASADLFCWLSAPDAAALASGEFRLWWPRFSHSPAGSTFARFSHLLPAPVLATVADHTAKTRPAAVGVYAELVYRPLSSRTRNVHHAPDWLPHRICLDRPPTRDSDIGAGELLVGSTGDHLYFTARGRRYVPISHCAVAEQMMPPLARFLLAAAGDGRRQPSGWSWGPLSATPRLPRLTYGRTILAPQAWSIPPQLLHLAASDAEPAAWRAAVRTWWQPYAGDGGGVEVMIGIDDRGLALRLDHDTDLDLLRREILARQITTVHEPPPPASQAWLRSADGTGHRTEIVIPLHPCTPPPAAAGSASAQPAAVVPPVCRRAPVVHLPGGEWLSIRLGVPPRTQNTVLGRLRELGAPLAAAGVDRWFLVRYSDQTGPHLRLRFHQPRTAHSDTRLGGLLAAVSDWAHRLHTDGLAAPLSLEPYRPETERYGGPDALDDAERLFAADTTAVLATLAAAAPGMPGHTVAALGMADLLGALDPRREHLDWLAAIRGHADASRLDVRAAVRDDGFAARLGPHAAEAWAIRRAAARRYAHTLTRRRPDQPAGASLRRITESVVHMHHNRLIGPDHDSEHQALLLVKDALSYLHHTRHTPDTATEPRP